MQGTSAGFVEGPTTMERVKLRPTRTDLQVRFADTDMLGHINNTSYAAFAEVGRSDFFTNIPGEIPWFVLARMEMDFRSEAFLSDVLHVRTYAERLGTTSMTLRQEIWRGDDTRIAEMVCVLVCIDRETRAKGAIPAAWALADASEELVHTTQLHGAMNRPR